MSTFKSITSIVMDILQLKEEKTILLSETPLLGAIPEFDSMAVVSIITALEEKFDFFVDDDEIDAEIFETVGSLVVFVEQKLNS